MINNKPSAILEKQSYVERLQRKQFGWYNFSVDDENGSTIKQRKILGGTKLF